jgi:Zn finger protein HypA/HybF involved in hydrogenase expression
MHELGVTRQLLEVVLTRAAQAGASKVNAVHIEIGEESDVARDSLEFYWADLCRATPAEGARLVFTTAVDPFSCRVTAVDAD